MTDLTPNHPAVEVGARALAQLVPGEPWPHDDEYRDNVTRQALDVITAALPHLTADDLRNTPAGRALMAEAWDQGAEAGERDYVTALDPDHECIPNPYRKDDA